MTVLVALLTVLALAPFVLVVHVYGLYEASLRLAARLKPASSGATTPGPVLRFSVIIAAHNQQDKIGARIANILTQDYPAEAVEIIVASDGSTDATAMRAKALGAKVVHSDVQRGKSTMQNLAVAKATGDVIVFTGAYTRFEADFLTQMAKPFADPKVGVADARLMYQAADTPDLGRPQGAYWRMELRVRKLASDLGVLLVCAGACVGVRRAALQPFPAHVGEDCVIPLDAARLGFRTVHLPLAIAHDHMKTNHDAELKARIRMTHRNWQGTLLYPDLLNPLRNPVPSYILFSHKLLRWLLPCFVIVGLLASGVLALIGAPLGQWLLLVYGSIALIVAVGAAGYRRSVFGLAWTFSVVNWGFLAGLWKAFKGERREAYEQ